MWWKVNYLKFFSKSCKAKEQTKRTGVDSYAKWLHAKWCCMITILLNGIVNSYIHFVMKQFKEDKKYLTFMLRMISIIVG